MKLFMMFLLVVCYSFSYASISDSHGYAVDGQLSEGEFGGIIKILENSSLIVNGGGAEEINVFDSSTLTVLSTSEPFIEYQSGLSWIVPTDSSSVTVSGGIVNYIYVQKESSVLIDGGQVNYIRSVQYASAGLTITIDCQNDWSWIGEENNYTGITGTWHNGNDFSISFLNDTTLYYFPDTWTHVQVIPEPTSIALLSLGGMLLKKRHA